MFFNPAEIIQQSLTAVFEYAPCASDQKHMISRSRIFFPESCVGQFAETGGKETFTTWARRLPQVEDVANGGPKQKVDLLLS
jgi:hypothetical protein